jgi:hypothetical protein
MLASSAMDTNGRSRTPDSPATAARAASDEALLRERLRDAVRDRPLLTVATVGAAGAALGGLIFTRLGRLAFVAVAGYIANELLHREGGVRIDELVAKLSSERSPTR